MTTLPPGHYYVGDLCYLFEDDEWDSLLTATGDLCSSPKGQYEWKGKKFFSTHTKYGDGEYSDQFGNTYGVDAGLIGCFPVPEGTVVSRGQVHHFSEPFTCSPLEHTDIEGAITIGGLDILTGDLSYDDEISEEESHQTAYDEDEEDLSYDEELSGNSF